MYKTKANIPFIRFNIVLAVILLIITIVFWITNIDQYLIIHYYTDPSGFLKAETFYHRFFYFPMNAITFFVPILIGFPIFLMSFIRRPYFKRFKQYFNHSLLLIATPMIGAAFVNTTVIKRIFSRPRPMLLIDDDIFYRPFEIAWDFWLEPSTSFPSGHVSSVFVLLAFFFAFRYSPYLWQKYLKWGLGVVLPLIVGGLMIHSRVVYGDHYLSDGIWAAAFMYYFVLIGYYILGIPKKDRSIHRNRDEYKILANKQDKIIITICITITIVGVAILTPIIFAKHFGIPGLLELFLDMIKP